MTTAITLIISFILILLFCYLFNKKENSKVTLLKVLCVIYFFVCFGKMFFADGFIWVINGGFYSEVLYEQTDVLQSILRWAMYFSSGILTMAVFTNVKVFKNIAIYFCLPINLLCTFFFNDFIIYYMDVAGRGIYTEKWIRIIILSAEMVLSIIIPVLLRVLQNYKIDYKNKKEWVNLLICLPILLISMFPVYLPQSIFGYTNLGVGPFTAFNYIWIILVIAIILFIINYFRYKSYDIRFAVCLWLCIILFMHYNSLYLMGFSIGRLPIQLCNLGAYFFIVALIFKWRKFFEFSFIANIVGTAIAMVAPDISGGIAYFWNIHFILEHSLVLIVPSVMMGLQIFPRLTKKSLKYVMIGFSIYFAFCILSGTLLNGFSYITGQEVNYFYIFDPELVLSIAKFLSFTTKVTIVWNGYMFYPIYMLVVFVLFSALMVLFYFLVRWIYGIVDDQLEIRKYRIELVKKIKIERKNNVKNI